MTGFPAAAYGRGAYGGEKWLQSMQPMRAAQGERQKSCREYSQSVQSVNQAAAGQLRVANFVISTVSSVPAAVFVV